jgi:membrane protein DedA with SNARE-associated domain
VPLPDHLHALIATYGYWVIALVIGLEHLGVPTPAEAILIGASIYAARTHRLELPYVVLSAALGATLGGIAGYVVGREAGFPLLMRYGARFGLRPERIKLGQYLFMRHGAKVVFLGRFVTLLRVLASLLAGLNCMPWRSFLLWNAAGSLVWATVDGGAAYLLGKQTDRVLGPVGLVILVAAVVGGIVGWRYLRRHEARLVARAEAALPGWSPVPPRR